jgi:hypothetical protein
MKKLMLASVLLLAACRPMSMEEVERAKLYCQENGATTQIKTRGAGFVYEAFCQKDGVIYPIPGIIIKVNMKEE